MWLVSRIEALCADPLSKINGRSDQLATDAELEGRRSSKGTLRFSFAEPVPKGLIARVAKFRAREFREAAEKNA